MRFLKNFLSSELGKGSLILFIMINIFNFLNYLFHFSMAHLLTPADYGILGVLMSLVYIYSIPAEAIQGIFSKYASKFIRDKKKTKYLLVKGLKKTIIYGFIGIIIADLIGILISYFLNINFWLIFSTNLLILGIFFGSVLRGVLQGRKKFMKLGLSMILESLSKLIIAIMLVLVGLKLFGPIIGLIIGFSFGIIFSLYFLKSLNNEKVQKTELGGIRGYSKSFFGVMISIVLMYSLDIIFARKFFSEDLAGKYTVISMLSKMIFFGTISLSKALFPISAEKFSYGKKTKNLFYKSTIIISSLCGITLIFFLLFPELIIGFLFGYKYIEVAGYLIYVGVALTFLSLTNLVVIYGLSIDRFKKWYFLLFFVLIEIILFLFFHKTILEFSLAFMFSNIIMFIGSLILIKIRN